MHLLDRPAVHPGLGLGEEAQDRQRARTHAGLDRCLRDPLADLDIHAVRRVLAGGRRIDRDPAAGQHAVAVSEMRDLPVRGQAGRAHRREGTLGELRPGIERGAQKHVAGEAAQRVEVDVGQPHARAQASA